MKKSGASRPALLWAAAAGLAGSLAIAGCSETASSSAEATAAEGEQFPNLATVPDEAPGATSRAERERIVEGLKADKANAEYTGEVFGDQAADVPPAEPPPPPPPPKPEQEESSESSESSAEEAVAAAETAPETEQEPVPEAAPVESVEETEVVVETTETQPVPEATPDLDVEQVVEEETVVLETPALESPTEPAEPSLAAVDAGNAPIGIVYFDANSATLSSEAEGILREVARIQQETGQSLRVVGHASGGVDQAEANMRMSMKRAAAVAQGLESLGVARESLEVVALGDTAPAADETTPEGEAANRRAEIFAQ